MKKKKYRDKKKGNIKVSETAERYLKFSETVEDMELASYEEWLKLSPEQRIAQATYLIENIFADQLRKKEGRHRLSFD